MDKNSNTSSPVRVAVECIDGQHRLTVNGEPFFVKGAGGGFGHTETLAHRGGNSIRTWSTKNAARVLDEAHAIGLKVLMGLDVARERHGFDYDDRQAVKKQLDTIAAQVREFKDHPALLAWGIGNELNLGATNPAVWDAVNEIATMIHELDGNHPATTMLAGANKNVIDEFTARCTEVDFLSIQMYGDVGNAKEKLSAAGYTGPYLITEWGATGHWEVPLTPWNAPIEQTSSEKADKILERYTAAVVGDPANCMGSYVFLWGQKQERTPTWYGLFTEAGEQTEAIDVMQYVWTGSWPKKRAPRLTEIAIGGKTRHDGVKLTTGASARAEVTTSSPTSSPISIRAEILSEATVVGEGGDYEPRPDAIPDTIKNTDCDSIEFTAPVKPGAYRLFAYVSDDSGRVATANLPFLVE